MYRMKLNELLDQEATQALLRKAAKQDSFRLRADDVMGSGINRIGGHVGHKLGKALGVRTGNDLTFDSSLDLEHSAIGCLVAATSQDMTELKADYTASGIRLTGKLPDSWAVFEGNLTVDITSGASMTSIRVAVEFPGQLFAWGAGKRTVNRFRKDFEDAVLTVAALKA
jgi:hypothetical protein